LTHSQDSYHTHWLKENMGRVKVFTHQITG